jgi:hypothetical protein
MNYYIISSFVMSNFFFLHFASPQSAIVIFSNLQGDKNLTGVTHVIVDEVHERSLLVS